MLERFKRRTPESAPYDTYEEATGERIDVEVMRGIRSMEDRFIELGHIDEADRYPVPEYLAAEWERAEQEDRDTPGQA